MHKLMLNESSPGICFLIEDFYPIMHGCTVQTLLLGQRLTERGLNVEVVTRQIHKEHSAYEKINGIPIHRVKPVVGVHRLGKYLMMLPALLKLVQLRNQYGVIIVCDLKILGILGVIVAKILRKSCLLNAISCGEVDGSFAAQNEGRVSNFRTLLIKTLVYLRNRVLFLADGFISISSAISNEFLSSGFSQKNLFQIYCGIDRELTRPVSAEGKKILREKLGFSANRYFVYTGRLVEGKGLIYLINAWKHLVSKFKNIHLVLVGAGQGFSVSCEEELRLLVKRNKLEETVTFTGSVPNVYDYLRIADYFVFPSQSEGLGLSLIEALAFELPCIATEVSGILDIIRHNHNGLLVPYGDELGLGEAMEEMLNDPTKAERLGKEGRRTVLEKFDLDVIADQYVSLVNQLCETGS